MVPGPSWSNDHITAGNTHIHEQDQTRMKGSLARVYGLQVATLVYLELAKPALCP